MEIPETWVAPLSAVKAVCRDAVIAGGCLRDLDHGRPVKDIDIFVNGGALENLEHLRQQLVDAGLDCQDIDYEKSYPIGELNDVVGDFEILGLTDEPIQLIMVSWDTSRITERFDFGICRVSFDGETLFRSDDYEKDSADQVFRLVQDRSGVWLSASVHRYARLVRKYEDWRFVAFEADATGLNFAVAFA